jgi:hypothetical protein
MTKAVWGPRARFAGAMCLLIASTACGQLARQGSSSSYLIVNAVEAANGADPTVYSGTLTSDVITIVKDVPTAFADPARVTFSLGLKDPGIVGTPSQPSQINQITINRYRVRYIRSDGRNTEGVDVPYGFDGAFTATVAGTTTAGFVLVRVQAKGEAPLRALAVNGSVISTIAEVTFYGQDQAGREVTAVANISVNFANWGDPSS